MANRQMFAQIGVFALLGLNVGAYYVFWPPKDSNAHGQPKAPEAQKEQARLLPQKTDKDNFTPPRSVNPRPVLRVTDAPVRAAEPQKTPSDDGDAVARLLKQIEIDAAPKPVAPPPLRAAEHETQRDVRRDTDVAVPSALTPKVGPELWLVTLEKVGTQTMLVAKLRNSAAEFKIMCDRVDSTTPGAVQAFGNVTVAGTGLNVLCQRMTVPLQHAHLLFEEKVTIASAGSTLRTDRIIWEAATSQGETQPLTRPLELRPTDYIAPIEKK